MDVEQNIRFWESVGYLFSVEVERITEGPPVLHGFRAINLQHQWLAFFLDVSPGQVSNWVTGKRPIPLHVLFVMTHLLSVLLEGTRQEFAKLDDLNEQECDRVNQYLQNTLAWLHLQRSENDSVPQTQRYDALNKASEYWNRYVFSEEKLARLRRMRRPADLMKRADFLKDFDPREIVGESPGRRRPETPHNGVGRRGSTSGIAERTV